MEYDPKKVLCSCSRATCGDVADAVKAGAKTLTEVRERTRATAFCGSCAQRVEEFMQQVISGEAVPVSQPVQEKNDAQTPAAVYRRVCEDIYMVGASDRRIHLFENQYPLRNGVSYNSYVILDQKTALLDTVDQSVQEVFLRNVEAVLDGRKLDYIIVNHMEPDHCAALEAVLLRHPESQIICTALAKKMIGQFFGEAAAARVQEVREGVSVMLGRHILSFHMAGMVHWPEVMVTYDRTSETLFSADAFGTFGALDGNLFADQVNFEKDFMDEARRYYTNIVGKYGVQVQALLQKAAGLKIQRLCPLHGPIWRRDLGVFLEKYQKWSSYTPEEKGVVIAYASIYGNTELACQALANALSEQGVQDVRMYDVSMTDSSEILSEAFRRSHLVLASSTFNGGIFPNMEKLLLELKAHNLKNRTVALMENGTWGPVSGRKMKEIVDSMDVTLLEQKVTLWSTLKQSQTQEIHALAHAIAEEIVG